MGTIDPEPSIKLQSELISGESLLWSGKPNPDKIFHSDDWYTIPFSLLWGGVMGNTAMQLLIALGLISGAIGGGALLLLLMDIIAKLLIRYARLHFRLFDSANKSL